MRGLYSSIPGEDAVGIWLPRLAVLLLTVAVTPAGFADNKAQEDFHIQIIRGLVREIAVSKIPLPRGKKGVRVDAQGKLDKADADAQLRASGMAIKAGMPVEITKVTFKSNDIVFELNGGKGGSKWWQHIEVGMGTATTPISQQPPVLTYGSWVTLVFPGKVPQMTVDQVKQALNSVLDFTRHSPSALYAPEVPAKFKEAIKNHQVLVGMDRDAVISSKGPPDRRVREEREGVEQEDWIYGSPPHVLFVSFDGDIVSNVHQY